MALPQKMMARRGCFLVGLFRPPTRKPMMGDFFSVRIIHEKISVPTRVRVSRESAESHVKGALTDRGVAH